MEYFSILYSWYRTFQNLLINIFIPIALLGVLLFNILNVNQVQRKTDEVYDVIVIGAGFSGIGVGKSLHENGIDNFIILEAKEYTGGRVCKQNFAGVNVPMGAGWVHSVEEDSLIWQLVKENNLDRYFDDYDDIIYRESNARTRQTTNDWTTVANKLDQVIQNKVKLLMESAPNDISLTKALRKLNWLAMSKIEKAVEYLKIDFENGVSADYLSASTFYSTGEGQDVVITDDRGYEYITNVISKPFKDHVKLKQHVTSVMRKDEYYFVKTTENLVFKSRYVIVSVSNSVLQSNLIKFEPSVPDWKLAVINRIVTGDYCKIFLQYPIKFWEDSNYIMIGHNERNFIHWQNLNRIYPDKNILMATLTGKECKVSQLQSDRDIILKVQEVLSAVYGPIPEPLDILRSNWTYDPYVKGAYTVISVGMTDHHYKLLKKPLNDDTLWFTGEHTGGFEMSGFVDGALYTGMKHGKELADFIARK